ncbi:hypothetical protein [Bradyrhizobium sp. UFLA05-112]
MKDSLRIEKLDRTHAVEPFTCRQPELDRFLIRHALQAQQSNSSQTYVALAGQDVIGFYTIVAGEALAACDVVIGEDVSLKPALALPWSIYQETVDSLQTERFGHRPIGRGPAAHTPEHNHACRGSLRS